MTLARRSGAAATADRLPRLVEAGETVVVPAGTVHRFEPIDAEGWAFTSQFALRDDTPPRPAESPGRPRDRSGRPSRRLRSDTEELASACRVSAGYLTRTFRRVTGTSPHNFHVLIVLQKAKALLRGGAPLAAAAFDSGFYDQAHLTREFVRTYGFTPKAYKSAWSAAA